MLLAVVLVLDPVRLAMQGVYLFPQLFSIRQHYVNLPHIATVDVALHQTLQLVDFALGYISECHLFG